MHPGVIYALLAAILFGASTPFTKTLVGAVAPVALAGLLYPGSGAGLLAWFIIRTVSQHTGGQPPAHIHRADSHLFVLEQL